MYITVDARLVNGLICVQVHRINACLREFGTAYMYKTVDGKPCQWSTRNKKLH